MHAYRGTTSPHVAASTCPLNHALNQRFIVFLALLLLLVNVCYACVFGCFSISLLFLLLLVYVRYACVLRCFVCFIFVWCYWFTLAVRVCLEVVASSLSTCLPITVAKKRQSHTFHSQPNRLAIPECFAFPKISL